MNYLDGEPFRGTILLGHLHWDHTQGLPFFTAGTQGGSKVTLVMPAQGDPEQVLERAFSPPHSPITPARLEGHWTVTAHDPGRSEVEGFSVLAAEIPHKCGRTFGYRISDGGATIAYLSDHNPIAAGADLLIHDAQYTASESSTRRHLGHSTIEYAVGLAEAAGARKLVLFHHDPSRTDDDLDLLVAAHAGGLIDVVAAAEGLSIDL